MREIMLQLTKSGVSREKAYRIVQKNTKESFSKDKKLIDIIKNDKFISSRLSKENIKNIFTYKKHLKNVDYIFKRIFR